MFVDASAMVAILAAEDDGPLFAERLEACRPPVVTTPLAVFETILALRRIYGVSVSDLMSMVQTFMRISRVGLVPIDAEEHLLALCAHEAFGRGSGHAARLNLGDCFAYAAAKRLGLSLLYKGDDFARTDLA